MDQTITIEQDDLSGEDIVALLRYHLDQMQLHSPICSVHAFPVERLRAGDVTFYALRVDGRLAGCGALKQIDARHGELKSMRTDPAFLRRGLGEAMLVHLIAEARARLFAAQPRNRPPRALPPGARIVPQARLRAVSALCRLYR